MYTLTHTPFMYAYTHSQTHLHCLIVLGLKSARVVKCISYSFSANYDISPKMWHVIEIRLNMCQLRKIMLNLFFYPNYDCLLYNIYSKSICYRVFPHFLVLFLMSHLWFHLQPQMVHASAKCCISLRIS